MTLCEGKLGDLCGRGREGGRGEMLRATVYGSKEIARTLEVFFLYSVMRGETLRWYSNPMI